MFRFPFMLKKVQFFLEGQQSLEDIERKKLYYQPQFMEINLQGATTLMFDLQFIQKAKSQEKQENQGNSTINYPVHPQVFSKRRLERYILNPLKYLFLNKLLKRNHSHNQVGLRQGSQVLVLGQLQQMKKINFFSKNPNTSVPFYRMNNPKLFIGSDVKELVDYIGIRSEWHKARSLRMVKVVVAVTLAHLLLVRIPEFYLKDLQE